MILNFYFGFNWNAIEKFGCSAESGAQTKVRVGLTRIAPCCSSVLNLMMKAISPEFLINLRPDTTLAVSARSLNVVWWSAIEMFSQLTPNKIVISAKVWILKNAGWSIEWLEHLEGWGAWPEPWIGVNGPGGVRLSHTAWWPSDQWPAPDQRRWHQGPCLLACPASHLFCSLLLWVQQLSPDLRWHKHRLDLKATHVTLYILWLWSDVCAALTLTIIVSTRTLGTLSTCFQFLFYQSLFSNERLWTENNNENF